MTLQAGIQPLPASKVGVSKQWIKDQLVLFPGFTQELVSGLEDKHDVLWRNLVTAHEHSRYVYSGADPGAAAHQIRLVHGASCSGPLPDIAVQAPADRKSVV